MSEVTWPKVAMNIVGRWVGRPRKKWMDRAQERLQKTRRGGELGDVAARTIGHLSRTVTGLERLRNQYRLGEDKSSSEVPANDATVLFGTEVATTNLTPH